MLFIFIVGITYLASLALMTPYLQTLMGYPVVTAGLVMGPRGLGTMVCMFLVGRLIGKVDTRWLLTDRPLLTAWAMYDMTGWTPNVSQWTIVSDRLRPGRGARLPVRAADDGHLRHACRPSSAPTAPASTICRATSAPASASRSCRTADQKRPGQPRHDREPRDARSTTRSATAPCCMP